MKTVDGKLLFPSIDVELAVIDGRNKYGAVKDEVMRQFQYIYCHLLLKEADGKIAVAARLAGTDRSRFKQMMRDSGVVLPPSSDPGEKT